MTTAAVLMPASYKASGRRNSRKCVSPPGMIGGTTASTVRLLGHAAIAAWPSRRTVLAVVPPIIPGGDTHFLELRRPDALYDAGIKTAAVVITAANFYTGTGAIEDPS